MEKRTARSLPPPPPPLWLFRRLAMEIWQSLARKIGERKRRGMWLFLNHKPTASPCAIMSLAVNADDAVHITQESQDRSCNTGFLLNFFPIGRCIYISIHVLLPLSLQAIHFINDRHLTNHRHDSDFVSYMS